MAVKIFPPAAKQRLMDTTKPLMDVEQAVNKALTALPQIPEFGYHNCIPKDAGRRLKNHADGTHKYALLEHAAHAKRRIRENLTQYIDGKLPVYIRAGKYELDRVKALQYAARIVGTAHFLQAVLQQEVAEANYYCQEGIHLVDFAESNLTPGGLRTQAEDEVARVLAQVRLDLQTQVVENNRSLECLI